MARMYDDELIGMAAKAREMAYAPYSNISVGAAVLTEDGSVFVGCNVENASLGLTICAERAAVFSAIAAGHSRIEAVAIVTGESPPTSPCGACRQVIHEFGPDAMIISANPAGSKKVWRLKELLPDPPFEVGS